MVRTPLHENRRSGGSAGPVPRWQRWSSGALLVLSVIVAPITMLLEDGAGGAVEQYPTMSGLAAATVLVAVPVLAGGLATASRGSPGGYVAWLGALGFLSYAWVAFAAIVPSATLLLVHTVLVTLSVFTLVGAAANAPIDGVAGSLRDRLPRVPVFGYLVIAAVLLAAGWLVPLLSVATGADAVEPVLRGPAAAELLLVLELGLLAPATAVVAQRLWTGAAWSYLAVGPLLVTLACVGAAILASVAAAAMAGVAVDVLPTAIVTLLTVGAVAFAILVLYSLGTQRSGSGWEPLGRA